VVSVIHGKVVDQALFAREAPGGAFAGRQVVHGRW
jgi:hypothetical protein